MAVATMISNSNKVPGIYLRVSLGVGTRTGGDGVRKVLLFGNQLSTGTAAVGVERDVFGVDEVRSICGAGSELMWLAYAATQVWPSVPMAIIPIAESAGTKGTEVLTIATTATKANTLRLWIQNVLLEVGVANTDTATTVGDAVVSAIAANPDLPVTAVNTTGAVTLTAKQFGPRGNHIRLDVEMVDPTGAMTATLNSNYIGGTVAGATSDDPQTAIDSAATLKNCYLVSPYDEEDQTQIDKFVTHVTAEDEPELGNRKFVVTGSIQAESTAYNIAAAVNEPRVQIAWMENSSWTPGMMAAGLAALRSRRESANPAHNYDGESLQGMPGHFSSADVPSDTALDAALNSGLTPISTDASGGAVVVRSITSKFQDANGGTDFRVLDTHKAVVPDFVADRLAVYVSDQFSGTTAARDADYTAPKVAPAGVTTESMVRDAIIFVLREFEEGVLYPASIVNVDALLEQVTVELSQIAQGRFNATLPVDVIEHFHQFSGDIRQIG